MILAAQVAYRGSILHFLRDPTLSSGKPPLEYFDDGALIVEGGKVLQIGAYEELFPSVPSTTNWVDYRGHLILPGFIDTHTHYPQTEMIGAYGEQLLSWLHTYTFPTEKRYGDLSYARKQAHFFIEELLRHGTTSALVFATVHKTSVDGIFEAALAKNMRIISGKVLMDRNAPEYLLDTPELAYDDSKELILKWQGKGRLMYAITPRFAPTSTPAQLEKARRLKEEFPETYIHTHLSENKSEVDWVKSLFPKNSSYFDVYQSFGLTGQKSIFAHSIYLSEVELKAMAETQSVAAFCPTSNLFLGSGLFPLHRFKELGIRIGLGTDVGAGTSFSAFQTLNEAYKVAQLQGQKLGSLEGFYRATLGNAQALSIDHLVGNFLAGKEADFVIIDPHSTPLLQLRQQNSRTLEEKLFVLMTLADERAIKATYVLGNLVHRKGD
jgi:guanine deaminase